MKAKEAREIAKSANERKDLAAHARANEQVAEVVKVIHETALQYPCKVTTSKPLCMLALKLLREDGYSVKDHGGGVATSWEISW